MPNGCPRAVLPVLPLFPPLPRVEVVPGSPMVTDGVAATVGPAPEFEVTPDALTLAWARPKVMDVVAV